MNVSANIIRFPDQPVASSTSLDSESRKPAPIVVFSPIAENDGFGAHSQEHGQVYAAHRIVARVADQLDSIAML